MRTSRADMLDFSFDARSATIAIPLPETFSFDETLSYLTRSPAEILHRVEDRTVYKLIEIESKPALLAISEPGDGSGLNVRFVHGASLPSDAAVQAAVDYVREWFDLRTDLGAFYDMAAGDSLLGPLTGEFAGLRIVGCPDLFEALCWAVIGQQVNLPFAYALKRRFVETFGEHIDYDGSRYWLFPKPRDIAAAAALELKRLQFTGKKAEYVIGIAQLMESGELSKESLLALSDFQEAERRMLAIRGIGPWTAHYVLMRCLRDAAAFPIGDVGLQNALKRLLQRAEKPAPEEIRRIFAPWQGWEAYAVFYLWRSLELG